MSVWEDIAEELKSASPQLRQFEVVRTDPIALRGVDTDDEIEVDDDDVEVSDAFRTQAANYPVLVGDLLSVLETPDGWVVMDAQTDKAAKVFAVDGGSGGANRTKFVQSTALQTVQSRSGTGFRREQRADPPAATR